MLKDLFTSQKVSNNTKGGGNQLSGTANLTRISADIAREILKRAEADTEKYQTKIVESQQSHDAMDALINEIYDLTTVDIDFLKKETADVLDRMIKSQQSKRSARNRKK